MIRRSTLFWLIAAILISCGLYQLKYEVQAKEERLARLNRQIQLEQEAIHVLHAEWAFLNRPDRLADLANRHLELAPVAPAQFGKVAGIPERPLHAVVAEAEVATPAAPPVKATSAPVKPAVKVQPATKLQVAEAKHSLGTIDLAQLRASAPAKPAGRDVVVIVDGTLLAHAQR
ncbi:MAG: hypothetical protein EXQ95_06235 [Alphaproteobacteria bacterium]|nr:hypothetical protein [Alphaproteobacteria bacterium]